MVLVCGIGNIWRSDDGAGVRAAELLKDSFDVIICDVSPEQYVEDICRRRPKKLLILDAAHFDGEPGEFRILDPSEIDNFTISTHMIPISLFVELVKPCCEEIVIYGIQVKDVHFGNQLSDEVKSGVQKLVRHLKETN